MAKGFIDLFGEEYPERVEPKGSRRIYATLGASNHVAAERQGEDYYATPPEAVEELLELECFGETILEPCVGGGHIARVVENAGHRVLARDIIDRGWPGTKVEDFLSCGDRGLEADVITNPPYSLAQKFVEKALDVIADGRKVAMLLRLLFAEGKSRRRLFEKNPPVRVWVSSSRLSCGKNGTEWGSSTMCLSWWVWIKGYRGETTMRWFN